MGRPPALRRKSEMKRPDQPLSLADTRADAAATKDEDKAVIVDVETLVGSKTEIARMIRNTPVLTAN
jgi:hypothetical protein